MALAPGAPPLPPDASLPPMLLLMSLHGDKDKPSDGDNALRRYRLSGGRTAYGRARLRLDELSSVAFAEAGVASAGDDVAAAEAGRRALLYPRGMALLPGGCLAVASAAGGDGGAVRVASAAAVCAAGGGMMPSPPSPSPPPPPRAPGPASAIMPASMKLPKTPRVASTPLCAAGLDHPYGIAVAPSPPRLLVTSQGSGVVSTCSLEGASLASSPNKASSASASASADFFARHGVGSATSAALPADADDDNAAEEAAAPTSDAAEQPGANAAVMPPPRSGGDASSPLRGVAVDPASGRVYVAAKSMNSVYEHAANGTLLAAIPAPKPIALLWDPFRGGLLIGSDAANTVRVLFWDATTRAIRASIAHRDGGGHAAGMALLGAGTLLVLGQGSGALYQFDLASGQLVATLATGLPRPEAILLYSGPCSA